MALQLHATPKWSLTKDLSHTRFKLSHYQSQWVCDKLQVSGHLGVGWSGTREGRFQPSLFDERGLAEIASDIASR